MDLIENSHPIKPESHWYYQEKFRHILHSLINHAPKFSTLCDVGAGTAPFSKQLAAIFPDKNFTAVDKYYSDVMIEKEVEGLKLQRFIVPADVYLLTDVLEHIDEDKKVLSQMFAALKPEGLMLLTVPQHAWLWSPVDEYACHERRYSASDLHQKIEAAGFRVIRSTSFVTILLPAMMISRFLQKKVSDKKFDATAELKISLLLNSLFARMLSAELALIKRGFNFPVGGSRLVVARKI